MSTVRKPTHVCLAVILCRHFYYKFTRTLLLLWTSTMCFSRHLCPVRQTAEWPAKDVSHSHSLLSPRRRRRTKGPRYPEALRLSCMDSVLKPDEEIANHTHTRARCPPAGLNASTAVYGECKWRPSLTMHSAETLTLRSRGRRSPSVWA